MKKQHIIAVLITLFLSSTVMADGINSGDEQALQKTMQILQDKQKRDAAINSSDAAKKADAYAEKVGGKHKEDIYQLASKVFEKMTKKYNGNPEKMKEALENAQRDPSGFVKSEFTEEELRALRVLTEKLQPAAPGTK